MPRPLVPCAGGCGGLATGTLSPKDTTPLDRRMCRPCRLAFGREAPRPGPVTVLLTCAACGVLFARTGLEPPVGRPCCSRTCTARVGRGRPLDGRVCEICRSAYRATYSSQRTCSRVCGSVLNRRGRVRFMAPARVWTCLGCSRVRVEGDDARAWLRWCSASCRLAEIGDRVNALYALASRAGARGALWRTTLVAYLRERDGDRCGICRRRIRFDLSAGPRGDDRGPSIDHMIPRSAGGTDELANLRLTHWGCNRARGAGRAGDFVQLALIG